MVGCSLVLFDGIFNFLKVKHFPVCAMDSDEKKEIENILEIEPTGGPI